MSRRFYAHKLTDVLLGTVGRHLTQGWGHSRSSQKISHEIQLHMQTPIFGCLYVGSLCKVQTQALTQPVELFN